MVVALGVGGLMQIKCSNLVETFPLYFIFWTWSKPNNRFRREKCTGEIYIVSLESSRFADIIQSEDFENTRNVIIPGLKLPISLLLVSFRYTFDVLPKFGKRSKHSKHAMLSPDLSLFYERSNGFSVQQRYFALISEFL